MEIPGPDWPDLLARSSYGLVDGIEKSGLTDSAGSDRKLLIIVDQFEEIFDYRDQHPEEADLFVQQILRAASHPGVLAYVLLTMRTDFLGKCALFRNLPEALNDGSYLVPRLTRQEQEEAVRSPLAVCGVEIDTGVVDQLLNAAEANRDELPVFQHLLKRLWEESGGGSVITSAHWERTGGWNRAIAQDAAAVLRPLMPNEQQAVRLVFQRVTKKGTGERPVRTPCSFTELAALCRFLVTEERLREVLAGFQKRDLLIWDQDSRIDIPHECITWRWGMLAEWIDQEDRDRQRLEFIDQSRRATTPLAGSALDEALTLRERIADSWVSRYNLVAAELDEHINHSTRMADDAVLSARKLAIFIGIGLLVAIVLGSIALVQAIRAGRERIEADIQRKGAQAAANELNDFVVRVLQGQGWSLQHIDAVRENDVLSNNELVKESFQANNALFTVEGAIKPLSIYYYAKAADLDRNVPMRYWQSLGYGVTDKTGINDKGTNVIWFREPLATSDIKRIALSLIRAGVVLRAVKPLLTPGQDKAVFIGYDLEFSTHPPWTVAEILAAQNFHLPRTGIGKAYVAVNGPNKNQTSEVDRLLIQRQIFHTFTLQGSEGPVKTIATGLMPKNSAEQLAEELSSTVKGVKCEVRYP